jgi:hypothetical protein
MRKTILRKILAYSVLALVVLQSCKDDSNLVAKPPIPDQSFVQEFDTLSSAQLQGWILANRSVPIGRGVWEQGMTGQQVGIVHTAYSSKSTQFGFISADYTVCHDAGPGGGTISCWAISPARIMQNGDKIIFYTRCPDSLSRWFDRLQVCVNKYNNGFKTGLGDDVGDFDLKLLDINPQNASGTPVNAFGVPVPAAYAYIPFIYSATQAYPTEWTRFEAKVDGLNGPTEGRFGLRYYVPYGGDDGRGNHISIDSVAYVSISKGK